METLDDFFDNIKQRLESSEFDGCSYPVYRGHSKGDYKLLPTLIRDYVKTGKDLWTLENNLYCDFRALAGPRGLNHRGN